MDDIGKKLGLFALSKHQQYTHWREILADVVPDICIGDEGLVVLAALADTLAETRREPHPLLDKIAENLHRAELTVLERAEHIAEWIRLTGAKEKPGQLVQVSSGGRGKEGGLSAAARSLPIAGNTDDAKRKNAQRAVKIAERTTDRHNPIRETNRGEGANVSRKDRLPTGSSFVFGTNRNQNLGRLAMVC